MKDKEKQIEEMAQCKNFHGFICSECSLKGGCDRYTLAEELIEQGYRKLPEDSVVLSKTEKEKLLKGMYEQGKFDAIADLEKDNVVLSKEELEEKYEPSEKFMSVARELEDLKQGLEDKIMISREEWRKCVDNENEAYYRGQHEAEVYYRNLLIPRERKETAEKFIKECKKYKVKKFNPISIDQRETDVSWIEMPEWKLEELVKQFGVE